MRSDGATASTPGSASIAGITPSETGTGAVSSTWIRSAAPVRSSTAPSVDRRVERVDRADHADHGGDRRADPDRGEQGPTRRSEHVAERHHREALPARRQALHQRREPSALRGEVPRPDRVDGVHPDGAPHRPHGREDRQREPHQGRLPELAHLERGAEHRQRLERKQHRSYRRRHQEADAHAEDDAEQRDLEAHQHRAQGDRPTGLPESHPDAELAPLRLHDPSGEVERCEHRGSEDQEGHRVHRSPVALEIAVQATPRRIVLDRGHRRREGGEGGIERGGETLASRGPVDPWLQPDDQVVHHARRPGEPLGDRQRHEHGREVRLGEESARLRGHHEVLGRIGGADVGQSHAAGEADRAGSGEPVMVGEVRLENGDGGRDVTRP